MGYSFVAKNKYSAFTVKSPRPMNEPHKWECQFINDLSETRDDTMEVSDKTGMNMLTRCLLI